MQRRYCRDSVAGDLHGSPVERRDNGELNRCEDMEMGKYLEQYRRAAAQQRSLDQRIGDACRKSGHARPRTRRDFLNQGLIADVLRNDCVRQSQLGVAVSI